MLYAMQLQLETFRFVVPLVHSLLGRDLTLALGSNDGHLYCGIKKASITFAGCNSDAVITFLICEYVRKTASGSDKVESVMLNDRAAERYSRIRYYMRLFCLWRAAMGRMPEGDFV
jgi:hypothetical protein